MPAKLKGPNTAANMPSSLLDVKTREHKFYLLAVLLLLVLVLVVWLLSVHP